MTITLSLRQPHRLAFRAGETALYSLWRLAISVRTAILSVLLLGLAALLGVLLPQIPVGVRDEPGLTAAWLELQQPRFGFLTPVLHRLGLFDVFHAWWFWGLVAWLAFAIVACTCNRLPAIWHQVFRPPRHVPDALFDRESVVPIAGGAAPDRVERVLRRRLFKVWRVEEGSTTYLFADRFPWAQLGTFATHLALIVFLAGALVTKFNGFSTNLTIAEGASAPVFPVAHENQILVEVIDAVGASDPDGRPLDFHSDLVLYRNGQEAKRCTATVNDPCSFDGYSFHQAGFFGFGSELRVRDRRTGNTVYQEVLALDRSLAAPRLAIFDRDGATLFDGLVPQTDLVGDSLGGLLPLPEVGKVFWVGLRSSEGGWTLAVFDPSQGSDGDSAFIPLGTNATVTGYTFDFAGVSSMPSLTPRGIPIPVMSQVPGDDGSVLLALENAAFGTRAVSAGDERIEQSSDEPPVLHIVGIAPGTVRLAERDRVGLGPYEYEFVGTRNLSGISVRKDHGDTLIWVASTLFVSGLVITLWLPRQRAWLRFRDSELRMVSEGRERVDISALAGNGSSFRPSEGSS